MEHISCRNARTPEGTRQSYPCEMRIRVKKNIALTDNLSLRRVIYSGRPVQEDRLKKEFVVIRDMMISEDVEVRYVPGKVMLADSLRKSANPEHHVECDEENRSGDSGHL